MAGRLGIDFGTSNTVLAVWDAARREGVPLAISGYTRWWSAPAGTAMAGKDRVPVIPSLIHYTLDRRRWLGNQVLEQGFYDSPRTFRWMKRFVSHRSPARVHLDGRDLTHSDAGKDFLAAVMGSAVAELNLHDEEIALTVPVEAYEHYENWLAGVAEQAGLPRFRLIDEPSAAALGYGAHIQPGQVYLIFDFGGGTLDVSMVRIEDEVEGVSGRRCRVVGKAGTDLGGSLIDQWLFMDTLRQNGLNDADEEVRPVSRALLVACEAAKEQLSVQGKATVQVPVPASGRVIAADFTQASFERLLDEHGAFTRIDQTVRRALQAAHERGFTEDQVQSVLLVGGSSLIPAIQRAIQRTFGRERVRLDRPLDAVARGAAAFVAGVDFFDHIQHDYAIRHLDPRKGEYDYRILVKRGTPYPTAAPLARLTIKASYDRQAEMGLAIFEIGERRAALASPAVELVFDPTGAARMVSLSPEETERRSSFWLNEGTPTFLTAEPPARRGEPRFEVEFSIDGNKRLLITSRDLHTGRVTHQGFPVVKLT